MIMTEQQALVEAARSGGLATISAKNNPFLKRTQQEGVTDGFWVRMNGKTGVWLTNLPNMAELAPNTELVFDVWNAEMIWQGFDKNSKLHNGPKVKIVTGDELPEPPPIPNVQWKKHIKINVALPDSGKQLTMICKADNPYREIWKLVKRYGELLTKYPDANSPTGYMMPVVAIDSKSYDMNAKEKKVQVNKETGKEEIVEVEQKITNYREVFDIVDDPKHWITVEEMNEIKAANGVEDAAPAAPAPAQPALARPAAPAAPAQATQTIVEVIEPSQVSPAADAAQSVNAAPSHGPQAAPRQGGFRQRVGNRTA